MLEVFKSLQVAFLINRLKQLIDSLSELLNVGPLSTIFLDILQVYFGIKLLLNVESICLAVDRFHHILLRNSNIALYQLFELIELLDDVSLALIQCVLHLLQVNLGVKLSS